MDVLLEIKSGLEKYFSVQLPSLNEWIVNRLDICYAWRLRSREELLTALTILKPYYLPRKKFTIRDTSIDYRGTTNLLRIYFKEDELINSKEIRNIKKWGYTANADKLLALAQNVLRYEVEIRDPKLKDVFHLSQVKVPDILNKQKLTDILNLNLSSLIKSTDKGVVSSLEVLNRMQIHITNPRKLIGIYCFHKLLSSNNPADKLVLDMFSKATKNKYLNQLIDCDIGLYDQSYKFRFNFSIPSEYEVGDSDESTAQ
jgi:hypothetical protein